MTRPLPALLLAALAVGCVRVVYEPPPPSADTDDTDVSGGARGPVTVTLEPFTFPRPPARFGAVAQGGAVYALRPPDTQVHVTLDRGVTWQQGAEVTGPLFATPTAVFAWDADRLARLSDAGRVATSVTLPEGLPRSAFAGAAVDGDGAIWAWTQAAPVTLWRSDDAAATFARVALPEGTGAVWVCPSAGGPATILADRREVLQWDGAGLAAVAQVTDPMACFVTAAGTTLVVDGYPGTQLRLPRGAADWERSEMPEYATFTQSDDALVRLVDGALEASLDDGQTWAPRVAGVFSDLLMDLTPIGDTLYALRLDLATGNQGLAALAPGATSWAQTTTSGVPRPAIVDVAFAEHDGRMAVLAERNNRYVLCVQDEDGVFSHTMDFAQAQARALALQPDGLRAFVGGDNGAFTIARDDGAVVDVQGQIGDAFGWSETAAVRSAAWTEIAGDLSLVVSTATEIDDGGNLVQYDAFADTWFRKTPERTATSLAVRPAGYHALAVRHTGVDHRFFVHHRSWVSANGWLGKTLETTSLYSADPLWFEAQPTYGVPALSASYSPLHGALAVLWDGGMLELGARFDDLAPVEPTLPYDARAARFDAQGHLWVVLSFGLLRSAEPVALP
jgi:hypothetical protein